MNRTMVLLRAKRHFFKAETLLAAKNVILNHRNYGVSCALLVISLCVFLNGMMYIRGLAAPYEKGQDYPKISLWGECRGGKIRPGKRESKGRGSKERGSKEHRSRGSGFPGSCTGRTGGKGSRIWRESPRRLW